MSPRARATIVELRRMWGKLRVTEGTDEVPLVIERRALGNLQIWKYREGRKHAAVFELVHGGGE